jgi:bisphosphoglycerate-dependent phosphoglycerate mutase
MPRDWHPNELILISKNKKDCKDGEKQIQYTMRLVDIRPLEQGEVEKYWPGNENRWKYLVNCKQIKPIDKPFNIEDLLIDDSDPYKHVVIFKKIKTEHKEIIKKHLNVLNLS